MTKTKLTLATIVTLALVLPTMASAGVMIEAGGHRDGFRGARADMHHGWRHHHHDKVIVIKKGHHH
jgi:hypothetical protein